MVLMVTENWWPAKNSEKIGKTYIEIMKKYPDDKTIQKPLVSSLDSQSPLESLH